MKFAFPGDFVWGAATSAYQVEGAAYEDGKGSSVWNEFERKPGTMCDDVNGDITCDQYHRFAEDARLMGEFGIRAYRFSVCWPRVFPDGCGTINQKGVDYYRRLCEELLKNGVEPYLTWYHWDLPLALQKKYGGWESRETVKYFGEYVEKVSAQLGGIVHHFFTMNEFLACADVAYGMGLIAPGLKLSQKRLNQVRHHLLLAHGTALAALRATLPEAQVGLAENPSFMVPVIDTPEHVDAAKKAFREENAHFLTAVMEGSYLDCYLESAGENAPAFTDADMKLIGAPMDFLGLNLYSGKRIRSAPESEKGYAFFTKPEGLSGTGIADFYREPAAMYWGCRIASELWQPKKILITENGYFSEDRVSEDGKVYDDSRIMYLRSHLTPLSVAVAEGIPVKGYFYWSLLDNLEWHHGFRRRFGLFYVNYPNGNLRIPKLSAYWYKRLIQSGQVC